MYCKQGAVLNPIGLRVCPMSEFIQYANGYSSSIQLRNVRDGQKVNGKSVVRLPTFDPRRETVVEIMAEKEDEKRAVQALAELNKMSGD